MTESAKRYPVFAISQLARPGLCELQRSLRCGDGSTEGDPAIAWQAENTNLVRDARNLRMPDKSNLDLSSDVVCPVWMSISDCLFHAARDNCRRSVYEIRGKWTIQNTAKAVVLLFENSLP